MKPATLIGIILVVLGLGALAYQGFSYTTREKILDVGPIEATTETTKTIPVPPILGVLAVIGGVVIVIATSRGRAAPPSERAGRLRSPRGVSARRTQTISRSRCSRRIQIALVCALASGCASLPELGERAPRRIDVSRRGARPAAGGDTNIEEIRGPAVAQFQMARLLRDWL